MMSTQMMLVIGAVAVWWYWGPIMEALQGYLGSAASPSRPETPTYEEHLAQLRLKLVANGVTSREAEEILGPVRMKFILLGIDAPK